MAGIVKTWDEVWAVGNNAGCTHWNYSRGKIRFRAILEEPLDIGEPVVLQDNESLRIRFYTLEGDEYVEHEEHDTWIKPPQDSLDFPENFNDWEYKQQQQFILTTMHRISASRFSKQMDAAERLQHRFIEFLIGALQKKDQVIGELYEKISELQSAKGITNMWEFLVHPNADRIVTNLIVALSSSKEKAADVIQELQRMHLASHSDPSKGNLSG